MLIQKKLSLRSFASTVVSILHKSASFADKSEKIAAPIHNVFDITKSNQAVASDGLGNVVRVPSNDGTGVSQAPASEAPVKGGSDASEQHSAALQGGKASPPEVRAASSSVTDADADDRQRLMAAVKAARYLITTRKPVRVSTKSNYERKQKVLEEQWSQLQRQDQTLSAIQIVCVLLGKYAVKSNSFYAMRRALHFSLEEQLLQVLKAQDKLQKIWRQMPSGDPRRMLHESMISAIQEIERLTSTIRFIQALTLEKCQVAYALKFVGPLPKNEISVSGAKSLVAVLDRRQPDWRKEFRHANARTPSPYRAHTLVQSLLGIRPAEFDPTPNPLFSEVPASQARSGVLQPF